MGGSGRHDMDDDWKVEVQILGSIAIGMAAAGALAALGLVERWWLLLGCVPLGAMVGFVALVKADALGESRARPALVHPLDTDPENIRKALQRAGTEWAAAVVDGWGAGYEKTMPNVAAMPESEMVELLRQLCDAWTTQSAAQFTDN